MNEDSARINELVASLRTLCQQVAQLLLTADDLVGARGWAPDVGNSCSAENSASVRQPLRWFPQYCGRGYRREERKSILLFVSVLFDNRENEPNFRVPEPLLTAGWFDFGAEFPSWPWWYLKYHGFDEAPAGASVEQRRNGGLRVISVPAGSGAFRSVATLGVPLVSVRNTDELQSAVVGPVLDELDEWVGANG